MYARIDPITGDVVEFPYTIRQMKEANPRTSFPKVLTETSLRGVNVVPVTVTGKPQINEDLSRVELDTVVSRAAGNYFVGWNVIPRSAAEKTALAKQRAEQKFESAERGSMGVGEKFILLAQYDEYQRYKRDNLSPTPMLSEVKTKVYPQLTIDQIGSTIENRALPYLKAAAVAWATKVQEGA